jgi:uncharacterized Zn finger protein
MPQDNVEVDPDRETIIATEATIACPSCGTRKRETMPTNACQHFYRCTGCGELLKPMPGDCCVFCSYSDSACPPKQLV